MAIHRLELSAVREHRAYPLQLDVPVARVLRDVLPDPAGLPRAVRRLHAGRFGEVAYGSTSRTSAPRSTALPRVFLRTLPGRRSSTALIILVGYPIADWIARLAPRRAPQGLLLLLIIVPFWTSFLIRTYAFLIVLAPEFFLSDWLQSLA